MAGEEGAEGGSSEGKLKDGEESAWFPWRDLLGGGGLADKGLIGGFTRFLGGGGGALVDGGGCV